MKINLGEFPPDTGNAEADHAARDEFFADMLVIVRAALDEKPTLLQRVKNIALAPFRGFRDWQRERNCTEMSLGEFADWCVEMKAVNGPHKEGK